jgi:hypothetical protein
VSVLETAGELATETDQDTFVSTVLNKACEMTSSPDDALKSARP